MPLIIQWIGFFVSVISFFISLKTLDTSLSVKKQIQQKYERESLKNDIKDIEAQIEGFVSSIKEDYIFKTDNDKTFRFSLLQFCVDVDSKFTILSPYLKKKIKKIHRKLNNPYLSSDDWTEIAANLITLKNKLRKENQLWS